MTSRAFWADPRKYFALALASMFFMRPLSRRVGILTAPSLKGRATARYAAGAGALPAAGATFAVFSAFSAFVPEWPLNVRVGENSPSL